MLKRVIITDGMDSLTQPAVSYLAEMYGIPADHIRRIVVDSEVGQPQTIEVTLYVQNEPSPSLVFGPPPDWTEAEAEAWMAAFQKAQGQPATVLPDETHTEETMRKVRLGLHLAAELSQTEVTEMINSMQNQGILFRERRS